jgi:hypothetical protein
MTAKSVIQVDIDPEGNFQAFYDLYKQYEAKIEESSSSWSDTNAAIDDAGEAMEKLLDLSDKNVDAATLAAYQANVIVKEIRASSKANADLLANVTKGTKAQKSFADEADRGARSFSKMAKDSKKVSDSVFGIGKHLLKLGALAGGIAGLGGILGGLGLRELASSAVDTQGNARALGINSGQYTAFNQDFGRYIDPSVLGSVANAQNSFNGRTWLARALGISQEQTGTQGPDQLAAQLALKAHDWWANTPDSMRTAENLQTTGLPQSGFSLDMVRQQGNTPRGELERAYGQYQQDQKRFNVSDKDTDAWYGFLRQIKDAGNTIETSLKNKLVALAPDLQKFVDVIGKDAERLITEVFTPKNLQSLADGIGTVSNYLGSEKFRQDMRDFAGLIGLVAEKIRAAAKFFGISAPSSNTPPKTPDLDQAWGKVEPDAVDKLGGWVQSKSNVIPSYFSDIEKQNKLAPGLLGMVGNVESTGKVGGGLNPLAVNQRTGAKGAFQFMGPTADQYGVKDPFDMRQAATGAGKYLGDLSRKYGGDVSKALAAYNWGPGNLDRDIAKNGSNWQEGLPRETKDYLNKIVGALARQQPAKVQVSVTNNTAARVAVQANAAAAQ